MNKVFTFHIAALFFMGFISYSCIGNNKVDSSNANENTSSQIDKSNCTSKYVHSRIIKAYEAFSGAKNDFDYLDSIAKYSSDNLKEKIKSLKETDGFSTNIDIATGEFKGNTVHAFDTILGMPSSDDIYKVANEGTRLKINISYYCNSTDDSYLNIFMVYENNDWYIENIEYSNKELVFRRLSSLSTLLSHIKSEKQVQINVIEVDKKQCTREYIYKRIEKCIETCMYNSNNGFAYWDNLLDYGSRDFNKIINVVKTDKICDILITDCCEGTKYKPHYKCNTNSPETCLRYYNDEEIYRCAKVGEPLRICYDFECRKNENLPERKEIVLKLIYEDYDWVIDDINNHRRPAVVGNSVNSRDLMGIYNQLTNK